MDGDAKFNFECKPLDFVCPVMEDFSTSLVRFFTDLIESMLKDGRQIGAGSNIWDALVSQEAQGVWWTIGIVITLLTGIVGMASATIRMDKQGIFRAILAMALSMPITVIVLIVVGTGIRQVDKFSAALIDGTLGDSIVSVFSSNAVFTAVDTVAGPAGGAVRGFWQIVFALLLAFIGALFMSFALAFRDLILILLIVFAPVAFAAMPLRQGSVWIQRWASAVIAMVLAKPLMFGSLKLFSVILRKDSIDPFSPEAFPLYLGMILCAFMPLMAFSFFNFVGSVGSDQVGSQAAFKGRQQLTSIGHNVRGLTGRAGGASRAGGAAAGAGAGAAAAGAGAALSAGKAAKGAVANQAANASKAASQSNPAGATKPNSGSASPQTSGTGSPHVPSNAQNSAGGAKNSGQQLRNAGSQGRFGDSPPPKPPKLGGSS